MTESIYKGRSFKAMTDRAINRLEAAGRAQQQVYADMERQARELATQQQVVQQSSVQPTQGEGVQQPQQQYYNPFEDENSAIRKRLAEMGKTVEDWAQMSQLERQRDVLDPALEKQWALEVMNNPQLQQHPNIDAIKTQWFNALRNKYDANFANVEAKEGLVDKGVNFLSSVGQGVVDVVDAVGDIAKPIFGNDNAFSTYVDDGTTAAREFLTGTMSEAAQQKRDYLGTKLARGDFVGAGKFMAENPLMMANAVGEVVGGVGGYGKGMKAVGALAGGGLKKVGAVKAGEAVAKTGTALGNSMPTYAGVANAGQTIQELDDRGVDVQSPQGILSALGSALTGAALTKLTPNNAENTIQRWLSSKNLSPSAVKMASNEMMKALNAGGVFTQGAKRLGRTGMNLAKGALNEGVEEFGQQYSSRLFNLMLDDDGKFRSWDKIPQEQRDQMLTDALAGGFMGTVIGGGISGGRNGLSRYGDAELAQRVQAREAFDARQDEFKDTYDTARAEAKAQEQLQAEEEQARQQEEVAVQAQQLREQRKVDRELARTQRRDQRDAEFAGMPHNHDIAEYANAPIALAEELEAAFKQENTTADGYLKNPFVTDEPSPFAGLADRVRNQNIDTAWATITQEVAKVQDERATEMLNDAKTEADAYKKTAEKDGRSYDTAVGLVLNDTERKNLVKFARQMFGDQIITPQQAKQALDQEVDETSDWSDVHRIMKTAIAYRDGSAFGKGMADTVKARADAIKNADKEKIADQRKQLQEQQRLAQENRKKEQEEERARKQEQAVAKKEQEAVEKAKQARVDGGMRHWSSTTKATFMDLPRILGTLQAMGIKLNSAQVSSFQSNPIKFLQEFKDNLHVYASQLKGKDGKGLNTTTMPSKFRAVDAQLQSLIDTLTTAVRDETAITIPDFWKNGKFDETQVEQVAGRGNGGKSTRTPSERQGQGATQSEIKDFMPTPMSTPTPTQTGNRVRGAKRFDSSVIQGAPNPTKVHYDYVASWVGDVLGSLALKYDVNQALVEDAYRFDAARFNNIIQSLRSKVEQTTRRNVGEALVAEATEAYGIKPVDGTTMRQFVQGADAQYLLNVIGSIESWQSQNKSSFKTERGAYENFVLMSIKNTVKAIAIAQGKLVQEKDARGNPTLLRAKKTTVSSLRSSGEQAMRVALMDDTLGGAVRVALTSKSLAKSLQAIKSFYKPSEIGGRVIGRLAQLAIDNDVQVQTMSKADMDQRFGTDVKGAYDNETGHIYIRDDMPFTQTVQTLVHESTHAFFNRTAWSYNAFIQARVLNQNADPATYGLTIQDVELVEQANELMSRVRGHEAFLNERYGVNTVVNELGETVAYGLSFDPTHPEAVAEFMAELYSSDGFRRATAEAVSKTHETSLKNGIDMVRQLLRKIAEFFGFGKPQQDEVAEFIEDSMSMLDTVPYRVEGGAVSRLAGKATNDEFVSRFVADAKRGIQFYTFKQKNGLGGQSIGVASAYRNANGTWNFEYINPKNLSDVVQKDGLTEQDLVDEAIKLDLQVLTRNGHTNVHNHLSEAVERIHMLHPALAKLMTKLHQFITHFMGHETATNTVHELTTKLLWLEHNLHDRDAIFSWIDRSMRTLHKDNPKKWTDLQRQVQALRAQYMNEFTERGIGRRSMKDHLDIIKEWGVKQGISVEQMSQMTYALMARERTKQFRENPGGIDPYTGKPIREVGKVSGFTFNGKSDDAASAYFNSLTAQQAQQVEEFRKMWVEMNDGMLDLEYASGVLSSDAYHTMRGRFYAPLKNEDSFIGAFYKRATGRHSEAKDPFSTYFEMAEARAMWALKQKENSLLLDLVQDNALGNILQVNQARRVGLKTEIGQQWQSPNMSDGSSWGVYKNGIKHNLTIADKGIADIYRSAKTWEEKSAFWNTIAHVTRAMSAVRTSLSPSFVPVAYARDLLTSVVNIQAAFRTSEAGQVLTDEEAMRLSGKVVARSLSSVGGILKGKWSGQRGWQYNVFKRLGGGINMNARMDAEDYNRFFQNALMSKPKTPVQMVGNVAKDGVHKLMQISHATEDSVRFATFMEFLEMRAGRPFQNEQDLLRFLTANPILKDQAISASKHITGNFEVKGNNIGMRSLFMFFNASMVGGRTVAHMFDPRHGTHALKMMGIIATLSLASLAMMDAELGDDEDGKSKASRVSATENGICWGMSGCLQLPHEVRWISALMKAGYEYAKDDISLGDGLKMFMRGLHQSAGVPFQFIGANGETTANSFTAGLLPTVAQLPFQLLTNADQFGRDIVPEYAYSSNGQRVMNAMDWQKARLSDPDWAKGMAMFGQKWLGIDNSASQYNHIANFLLGSIYTNAKRVHKGMANGDSFSDIIASVFGAGLTPRYDDYAMVTEMKNRISTLKSELQMGEDVHNMVRPRDELKSDSRYAKLVALEKEYDKAQRAMTYNGKSYSELIRERQSAIQTDNIDAILEANTGLDVILLERQQRAGQILRMLDQLEMGY